MNIQDYVSMGQTAAITLAFLYMTFHLPGLLNKYWAWRDKMAIQEAEETEKRRQFDMAEREKERAARHRVANDFQDALARMWIGFKAEQDESRSAWMERTERVAKAIESMCQYKKENS